MLPGMFPAIGSVGSGRPAITSVTLRSSSSSDAIDTSPVLPATIVAGDLIIVSAVCFRASTSSPTANVPSGWTTLSFATASGGSSLKYGFHVLYKIADGTEDSTTIDPFSPAGLTDGYCCGAYNAGDLTGYTLTEVDEDTQFIASFTVSDQIKNVTTLGVKPFFVVGAWGATSGLSTSTWTGSTPDDEIGGSNAKLKTEFYGVGDTPGSDITLACAGSGGRGLYSSIIEIE